MNYENVGSISNPVQFSLAQIVKAMPIVSKFVVQSITANSFLSADSARYTAKRIDAFYETSFLLRDFRQGNSSIFTLYFTTGFPAKFRVLYYESIKSIKCRLTLVLFLLSSFFDTSLSYYAEFTETNINIL